MFDTGRMSDELKALKVDVTRLLSTAGEGMFETSRGRAEALADLITERPMASLASAFALGVVVGFMLRRH